MVDQSKLAAQTDAVFKSSRGYAEGGMPEDVDMQRVDPVSGNEIPPGSLAEEVRDDIPAQLSEGEYVVPADVVRYYGVKFFEDLRTDAKMGWDSLDKNGRIGGEPMAPAGMEMADDELPFDIAELHVVDVPDDDSVLKAAEGMYVSGYGFGDFVKTVFGGLEKQESINGKPKAYSGYEASGYAEGGWALAPGDEGYEEKGALGFGPEGLQLSAGLEIRKYLNADGDILFVPFIDGVAQIEIPEGYLPEGEIEVTAKGEGTAAQATTEASPWVENSGQFGTGDGSSPDYSSQAINYKELTTEELSKMVEDQQGIKGDAIAMGMGVLNPVIGLAIKFALANQAKRLEEELQRRSKDPSLATSEKVKVNAMLETVKKDKPGLIKRIFEKTKDAADVIEDIINPTLSKEQKEAADKVNQYKIPSGLGTESETQKEERLMDQYVEAPTSKGVEPPSPITVEELPPAEDKKEGLFAIKQQDGPVVYFNGKPIVRFDTTANAEKFVAENSGLLPQKITYDDLLMGDESPVNKTLSLDEIISTAEGALEKLGDVKNAAIKKGMELGSNLENDPLAFMKAITPEVYTPSATVPRVPTKKSSQEETSLVSKPTKQTKSKPAPTPAPTPAVPTSSGSFGPTTDWAAVRKEAQQKSTKAIVNATNNLATKEEIDDMKSAAKRVDSYLESKETGKPTGTYGFAEGGTVEMQYTGLDAVNDMQKLNQYI